MKRQYLMLGGLLMIGFACLARGGSPERIGHTTLLPRDSNPDDRGMYTALIDPTNGYAYFVGQYLFKLNITANLPVLVGTNINCGQANESAIDPAAGYLYLARTTINRYALGVGTNAPAGAGTLALAAGSASSIVIDDSDPTNHYGYVVCTVTNGPARVAKVALATFTELGSITLNANESNFWFGRVDAPKGYAYFESFPNSTISNIPLVVKIKMTPGTNPPVRIGSVNLDATSQFIDGAAIDIVHGYAYYDTYDSPTNIPGHVYKVQLGDGDVAPTVVGRIDLHPGEGRLSAGFVDPVNGYLYFANDNTYPGGVYQFALNGTNLPVELGYLPFQSGPLTASATNGVTANNVTTNADGILPYGEVYIRSAVFDPLRGNAYFGQDSRPNQVIKVQVGQNPFVITSVTPLPGGDFEFVFTAPQGESYTALAATNLSLAVTNWTAIGSATETSPGQFEFIDPQATNFLQRFYRASAP